MDDASPSIRFTDATSPLRVRAILLGQGLNASALELVNPVAEGPALGKVGSGVCVLLRYGAIVTVGMTPEEERLLVAALANHVEEPLAEPEEEDAELVASPDRAVKVHKGRIQVTELNVPVIQLVGEVLARSVALNHYEEVVAREFERMRPWAEGLTQGHRAPKERELLGQVGRLLSIGQGMVGRVEVRESPELLWENEQYERVFLRLRDHYELIERDVALDRKLDQLSRTVETLVELQQNRHSVRLEAYIVGLIVIEVLLMIYELWFRG